MTEAEWLACNNPIQMLKFLGGNISVRKLRLLAVACCRRAWHLLIDQESQKAVQVAERYAEGQATGSELGAANYGAAVAAEQIYIRCSGEDDDGVFFDHWDAALAAECITAGDLLAPDPSSTCEHGAAAILWCTHSALTRTILDHGEEPSEHVAQSALLRDIFPNPFRPAPALDPAWLRWHDATIPRLAQQMYDSRDFPACQSWPTPWKRPAAPAPISSITATAPAPTSGGAGWWI